MSRYFCDIYYHPICFTNKFVNIDDPNPSCMLQITSNLIPYKPEKHGDKFQTTENNTFICCDCKLDCLIINDSEWGLICPSCFHTRTNGQRSVCEICLQKTRCDTCGSESCKMIYLPNIKGREFLLCDNNFCLMPFNYMATSYNGSCTCNRDLFERLTEPLIDPIKNMIKEMMDTTAWNKQEKYLLLQDGSMAQRNKCLKHQEAITRFQIVKSVAKRHPLCQCSSIFNV